MKILQSTPREEKGSEEGFNNTEILKGSEGEKSLKAEGSAIAEGPGEREGSTAVYFEGSSAGNGG